MRSACASPLAPTELAGSWAWTARIARVIWRIGGHCEGWEPDTSSVPRPPTTRPQFAWVKRPWRTRLDACRSGGPWLITLAMPCLRWPPPRTGSSGRTARTSICRLRQGHRIPMPKPAKRSVCAWRRPSPRGQPAPAKAVAARPHSALGPQSTPSTTRHPGAATADGPNPGHTVGTAADTGRSVRRPWPRSGPAQRSAPDSPPATRPGPQHPANPAACPIGSCSARRSPYRRFGPSTVQNPRPERRALR